MVVLGPAVGTFAKDWPGGYSQPTCFPSVGMQGLSSLPCSESLKLSLVTYVASRHQYALFHNGLQMHQLNKAEWASF